MFLCKILPLYNKSFNILLFFSHRIHISEYILITKWKGDFMNYLYPIIISFLMIFLSELGDKTQLLAMAFATKYPWKKVMFGILVATILNHFVAIAAGIYLHSFIPKDIVELVASIAFIVFGLWILKDDELGNEAEKNHFSIFWTVAIAFFLAEMGDKTQLATVALSAQIGADMLSILVGTTLGMLVADGLGILLGATLHKYVPDRVIKNYFRYGKIF